MKNFFKNSLTSLSVRQGEFGETPWTIEENALAHWLICPQEVGRINKKIIGKEFGIAPDSFLLVSV